MPAAIAACAGFGGAIRARRDGGAEVGAGTGLRASSLSVMISILIGLPVRYDDIQ